MTGRWLVSSVVVWRRRVAAGRTIQQGPSGPSESGLCEDGKGAREAGVQAARGAHWGVRSGGSRGVHPVRPGGPFTLRNPRRVHGGDGLK